jgi:DNA-binding transcriptional ArsR family regulator
MVTGSRKLDRTFGALADGTRRAILARLAQGDATVGELARPFRVSRPAISKHLRVLENAGLISKGRDGQKRPCRIEAEPLEAANEWLERYRDLWEQNYQRLDNLLETLLEESKRRAKSKAKRKKK